MTEKQYPELPDPTAWRSYDNLLKRARYDAVPITSTQPGIYSHTRMFTEDQTRAFADATCAMRAEQAAPAAVAGPSDRIPIEDSIAWQETGTGVERNAVMVSGRTWYRDDHPLLAPTTQAAPQEDPREDASYESMCLAVMVLSDCGHSSNYTPLLERVAGRIDRHVERLLTAQRTDLTRRAQAESRPWSVWGGKLSDRLQKALNALYLECPPEVVRDLSLLVQQECEEVYASYNLVKRMYHSAQSKLDMMKADKEQA